MSLLFQISYSTIISRFSQGAAFLPAERATRWSLELRSREGNTQHLDPVRVSSQPAYPSLLSLLGHRVWRQKEMLCVCVCVCVRVFILRGLVFHFSLSCIGEGNGNPLQCSCLENPRDREAWWAAIYGVVWSRTRLKRLSSSSSRLL